MSASAAFTSQQEDCSHEWHEEYYGYHCSLCDLFYPFGCAPWDDLDELANDDEDEDF